MFCLIVWCLVGRVSLHLLEPVAAHATQVSRELLLAFQCLALLLQLLVVLLERLRLFDELHELRAQLAVLEFDVVCVRHQIAYCVAVSIACGVGDLLVGALLCVLLPIGALGLELLQSVGMSAARLIRKK